MPRDLFIVGIAGLAIVNGLFSPALIWVFPFVIVFYPPFLPSGPGALLFTTSLLVSTLTLMLSGVPAALYERATVGRITTETSLWIWLVATALLALPAVTRAISLLR